MDFTWFGSSKFVSESYFASSPSGSTPRVVLTRLKANHLDAVRQIDRLLETSGPEEALLRAEKEIKECHPGGKDKRCNCSHTVDIRATGKPRTKNGEEVTVTEELKTRAISWLPWR